MPRAFARCSLADAVARLGPAMKVLLPPACGEPAALVAEICRQSARLRDLTLLGGIHLGDYPLARPEHAALRFATWHMSPRLEEARRRGRVEFVPIRYFDLVTQFVAGGVWAPDCVLVHCAPPDARGYLSLGVSVSVALPAARRAPLVIAQVNPSMPRTLGNACLHRGQIDCWVEVDEPLTPYPPHADRRGRARHRPARRRTGARRGHGAGRRRRDPAGRPRGAREPSRPLAALAAGRRRRSPSSSVASSRARASAFTAGRMDIAEAHGDAPALRLPPREPAREHGALELRSRSGDRGAPGPLRRDQLRARDRPGRSGDGGEPGAAPGRRASAASSTSSLGASRSRGGAAIIALPVDGARRRRVADRPVLASGRGGDDPALHWRTGS